MNIPRPTTRSKGRSLNASIGTIIPMGRPQPTPPPDPPKRAKCRSEYLMCGVIAATIERMKYLKTLGTLSQLGVDIPRVEILGIMPDGGHVFLRATPKKPGLIPQLPISLFDLELVEHAPLREAIRQAKAGELTKKFPADTDTADDNHAQLPLAAASSS